jgi:putative ABC transport system ATP-binding protein
MNPAVVCSNLEKDFGQGESRVRVLRGVNLEIPYGEMSLLVGPSGSGKTTLISVIAGLLNPTAGHLAVLGQDLAQLKNGRAIQFRRRNLGFVFQQYNLLPSLNAVENAAVPLVAAGVSREQANEKAADLLRDLGLGDRLKAYPNTLSGGQQQRVAIARALVHEPRLIVCDEPTAALDHQSGHYVMELLRAVAVRPDRSVIVVTHDSRVFEFGDRIAYMDDAAIVGIETKAAIGEMQVH